MERPDADVAELADALDLGSSAARRVGSTPTVRTNLAAPIWPHQFGRTVWPHQRPAPLGGASLPVGPRVIDAGAQPWEDWRGQTGGGRLAGADWRVMFRRQRVREPSAL